MKVVKILSFIFVLSLYSCSSKKESRSQKKENKGTRKFSKEKNKQPSWITNPSDSCFSGREICAVGEGAGRIEAMANAQKEIAQAFETTINSELNVYTEANQESGTIVKGGVNEEVDEKIKTLTENVVLKGVVVKQYFVSKDSYFVLASLNKNKASGILKSEINFYDDQMISLLKTKKRIHFRKLLKLYESRERVNNHYQVLKGRRVPKLVSYDQIYELKNVDKKNAPTIFLMTKGNLTAGLVKIKKLVLGALLESNYKVVTNRNQQFDIEVMGQLDHEKQFLNVSGFVKYKFLLSFESRSKKDQKLGAMALESVQTARTLRQAFEKAMNEFSRVLIEENRISELELGQF